MQNDDQKNEALQFLMTQRGGVLSTASDNQPHSAFLYYDADEDFSIYFVTTAHSKKHENIQANNNVSFTVATITPPKTVQLEGLAEEVTDKSRLEAVYANYIDAATYHLKHSPPITKLGIGKGIVVYRIRPTLVLWSDYSSAMPDEKRPMTAVIINKQNPQ